MNKLPGRTSSNLLNSNSKIIVQFNDVVNNQIFFNKNSKYLDINNNEIIKTVEKDFDILNWKNIIIKDFYFIISYQQIIKYKIYF